MGDVKLECQTQMLFGSKCQSFLLGLFPIYTTCMVDVSTSLTETTRVVEAHDSESFIIGIELLSN